MVSLEQYFKFTYLDDLATSERIYYNPSVGWDKVNSKKINDNKYEILTNIAQKVLEGNYKFVPYRMKLIIKNKDSKPRKTCIPAVKDRIVISAIKRYLYDVYKEECFNIPAKSIIKEITNTISECRKSYYKKIDLSSFFDNIDHEILLNKLSEKIDDVRVLNIISKILQNPQKHDEREIKLKNYIGVPQGLSISTLLANIYMHELDLKYKNRDDIKYFRYVDDIIIFSNSKQENIEIYKELEYDLQKKYLLTINNNKTKEGYVKDGLEYLGYKFEKNKITVRKNSVLKFEKNLEMVFKNFSSLTNKSESEIKKFIWLLNVKITGIMVNGKKYGWLYYFNCINDITLLKKFDMLIEKLIKRFKINQYVENESIKKFTRTYFEINKNLEKSQYLLNLNNITSEEKIVFLKDICMIEDAQNLSGEQLEYKFRYNLYRTIKNLEKDIDAIS